MMPVSAACAQAITALSREIKVKLEIYFDGPENPPTVFDKEIVSLSLLEESFAESRHPVGTTTANVLDFTLYNYNNQLSLRNEQSPYYGKLVNGVKVVPYFGVVLADESIEYHKMGEFYTTNWYENTTEQNVGTTCYDILSTILNLPVTTGQVQKDKYGDELLQYALSLVGKSSIPLIIHPRIRHQRNPIKVGFVELSELKNFINVLNEANLTCLYVNRQGYLVYRPIFYHTDVDDEIVDVYHDRNFIMNSTVLKEDYNVFDDIVVRVYNVDFTEEKELLKVTDTVIAPGSYLKINKKAFNSVPVMYISTINCEEGLSLRNIDINAFNMSFEIVNNASVEKTANISVWGSALELINSVSDPEQDDNVKLLDVNNKFIQSIETANMYATKLKELKKSVDVRISVVIRGDPRIELFDLITIQDSTNFINTTQIIPHRLEFRYDGGLECTITGYKAEGRVI